jgi:Leucine-rich repeat (LRR) protein
MMADAALEVVGAVADTFGFGAVSPVIQIVNKCIETYQNFQSFQEEANSFRDMLVAVRDVLLDVEEQFTHRGLQGTRNLKRPLHLIMGAVEKGGSVLEACTQKNRLKAIIFSKTYLTNLSSSKADIEFALTLISACGVSIQGRLKNDLDSRIEQLDQSICTQSHNMASQVNGLIQPGMDALPDQIVEKLVQLGLVTGRIDCNEQLREIQEAKKMFLQEKAFADEDILERILSLSLYDTSNPPARAARSSTKDDMPSVDADAESIETRLFCPILQDVVQDPVLLIAGNDTRHLYDRKALCGWLAINPYTEPQTGLEYDEPLHFVDSLDRRQLLQQHYGKQAYVPYNNNNNNNGLISSEYDVEEVNKDVSLTASPLSPSPAASRPTTNSQTGIPPNVFRAFLTLFCLLAIGAAVVGGAVAARNKRNRDSAPTAAMAMGRAMPAPNSAPTTAPTSIDQPRFRAVLDATIGEQLRAFSPDAYESALGWMAGGTENHLLNRYQDAMLFEQRFVLAWFWYHTTKNGEELWKSCNPPHASSLDDEGETDDTCVFLSYTGGILHDGYDAVNATRWLSNTNECTWPGISCTVLYNNEVDGLVTEIVLPGMNLQGDFPIFLSCLPELSSLELSYNKLVGVLPTDFSSFKRLTFLAVSNNTLYGTIPDSVYSIPNLRHLYLDKNRFSGQLSSRAIAKASALILLSLYGNALTGNFPDGIGQQLLHLQLNDNQLTGMIPDSLYNMTNLQTLYLDTNSFTGPLKPAIGNLKSLVQLSIFDNQLTGTIPFDLSKMTSLDAIWLHRNQFSGSVPVEICNLKEQGNLSFLIADCQPPPLSHGGDLDYNTCDCCTECCDRVDRDRDDCI